MSALSPTVEEMFQQMMNAIEDIANRSEVTNTRLDKLVERIEAVELAQSMTVYPSEERVEGRNPQSLNSKRSIQRSRSSSPTLSESGDKESSVAHLGTKEDLAAVLDDAPKTPSFHKVRASKGKEDRRDSIFARNLSAAQDSATGQIKYHDKVPAQPENLTKIGYRHVITHLTALLEYEHKYQIKLTLGRSISQACVTSILSRFNITHYQFHNSSVVQILTYLSTMCTPSTRQEMTNFLTIYAGSLFNITKVPTASNISYFVNALQEYRQKIIHLLEFISFDPNAADVMPPDNFKKDPPGLWFIIQEAVPFSWFKNVLNQQDPSRKNIKTTNDVLAYFASQGKELKEFERKAKVIENMFTGTSADQQRKDASAARYPVHSKLHAIAESPSNPAKLSDEVLVPFDEDFSDKLELMEGQDDEYSFQDEAENIASTSYDNSSLLADFNYDNRAVVYEDVLDQKSYVEYVHEHFMYPNVTRSSLTSITAPPAQKLDRKQMPCFQFVKQTCNKTAEQCDYSHSKDVINKYLDSLHAGVTNSKKAVHAKSKDTFKALSNSTSNRPPQIYSNTQPRQIPTGQGYRPSISSISNSPAISLHNHNDLAYHYDDFVVTDGIGREQELHDRLERISGLNLLDSAIHSDCVVTSSLILQDGSKIESRTLADTGCTKDNFMSEGHYLAYPVLEQYLVKHPTNTIDLATHGSTATVSKYISVVLEIVHRGKPIRCKILIGIMKGLRYDLVLGLAVIASHYTDVLLDLLSFQLQQPSTTSVNSISMMPAPTAEDYQYESPTMPSPTQSVEMEDGDNHYHDDESHSLAETSVYNAIPVQLPRSSTSSTN